MAVSSVTVADVDSTDPVVRPEVVDILEVTRESPRPLAGVFWLESDGSIDEIRTYGRLID